MLIEIADNVLPPVPVAALIAAALNGMALAVDPSASTGPFASPFACLTSVAKAEVLRRLETDPVDTTVAAYLLHGIVPIVAIVSYSEAGVFDRESRTIRRRPVGWDITRYAGVREGRDAFLGYWQDRTSTRTDPRYAKGRDRRA